MKSLLRNRAIEERFLDFAGRPLAGVRGKKNRRPAPLEMTVFGLAAREVAVGLAVVMRLAIAVGLVVAVSSFLAPRASAQVTSERLLNASKEPQNWLMYSGNYAGHRFSALDQINTSNAASLVPKWAYQTMAGGKFETTPLVVDGVLYGTGQEDRMFALDAKSGRPIWQIGRAHV